MKIQHKRSAALDGGNAKEPTAAQTDFGEVCVNFNTQDPALFIRDNADNIVRVGGDLSLYQKIEDTPPPVFVCASDEINAQSPPAERLEGTLWWNTEAGILYVWYIDANSSQWVIAVPQASLDDVPPGTVVGTAPPIGAEEGQLWWNSDAVEDGGGRLYVYYDNAWIDTSVPGAEGSYLTTEEANNSYLKLDASNSPVTGALTFNELTTHEAGVKVTGGEAQVTTPGFSGMAKTSNSLFIVTDSSTPTPLNFWVNGKNQASVNSLGRFDNKLDSKSPGTSCIGFQTTGDVGIGVGTDAIVSYRADFGIENDYGDTGVPNTIDGASYFATTSAGRSSLSDAARAANRLGTYAGFKAVAITNAALKTYGFYSDVTSTSSVDNYNFYAAGGAPNYFKGYVSVAQNTSGIGDNIRSVRANAVQFNPAGLLQCSRALSTPGNFADCQEFLSALSGDKPASVGRIKVNERFLQIEGTASGPLLVGTGADARNISSTAAITNATAVVQQLNPVRINDSYLGFTAADLQPVVSEAVVGTADETEAIGTLADYDGTELETEVTEPSAEELTYAEEVETDGVATMVTRTRTWTPTGTRPIYQGVDQTKLIPLLTKALQEVMQKNEDLEARIAALEGA